MLSVSEGIFTFKLVLIELVTLSTTVAPAAVSSAPSALGFSALFAPRLPFRGLSDRLRALLSLLLSSDLYLLVTLKTVLTSVSDGLSPELLTGASPLP